MAVGGGIRLPGSEAAIPRPRDPCGSGIDFIEISQDRADGVVKAVEVKPMKCRPLGGFERRIVRAQPVHERAHFVVPPHPGRKARKGGPLGGRIFHVPDIVVDPRRIRPVSLDRDEPEAFLGDQFA